MKYNKIMLTEYILVFLSFSINCSFPTLFFSFKNSQHMYFETEVSSDLTKNIAKGNK